MKLILSWPHYDVPWDYIAILTQHRQNLKKKKGKYSVGDRFVCAIAYSVTYCIMLGQLSTYGDLVTRIRL